MPMLKIKNKLKIGCFYKQSWEELAIFWAFLINNIPLALVGYEMIIAIHHLISNAHSWNNYNY